MRGEERYLDSDKFFCNQLGNIIRKILKETGCHFHNVHALRHTAAEVPATLVQVISKHADIETMFDVYGSGNVVKAHRIANKVFSTGVEAASELLTYEDLIEIQLNHAVDFG